MTMILAESHTMLCILLTRGVGKPCFTIVDSRYIWLGGGAEDHVVSKPDPQLYSYSVKTALDDFQVFLYEER